MGTHLVKVHKVGENRIVVRLSSLLDNDSQIAPGGQASVCECMSEWVKEMQM